MKLRHLRPRTLGHCNGAQKLEATTGRVPPQDHHIFQPSQSAILETAAMDIKKGSKRSIRTVRIRL